MSSPRLGAGTARHSFEGGFGPGDFLRGAGLVVGEGPADLGAVDRAAGDHVAVLHVFGVEPTAFRTLFTRMVKIARKFTKSVETRLMDAPESGKLSTLPALRRRYARAPCIMAKGRIDTPDESPRFADASPPCPGYSRPGCSCPGYSALALALLAGQAARADTLLPVTPTAQAEAGWSWAAVSQMIMDYYDVPASDDPAIVMRHRQFPDRT